MIAIFGTKYKKMSSTIKLIENRIKCHKRGSVFFHSDFADLGSSEATRKAVKRLCDDGMIRRCGRGIYSYPKVDTYFGLGEISASNIDIAQAYAKNKGIELYLTTSAAQNILGLETQNQIKTIYLTNGSSTTIKTNNGEDIKLIHTSDKNLSKYKSDKMRLLNIALSGYGKESIDDSLMENIKKIIKSVDVEKVNNDIKLMNSWKRNLIYSLLQERS